VADAVIEAETPVITGYLTVYKRALHREVYRVLPSHTTPGYAGRTAPRAAGVCVRHVAGVWSADLSSGKGEPRCGRAQNRALHSRSASCLPWAVSGRGVI